jgi:hypothetical protein
VATRIREEDRHIRLVATSGYSADPIIASPRAYGFDTSLAKPFLNVDIEKTLCALENHPLGSY